MKAILQRVTKAKVTVNQEVVGSIGEGWYVLLGIKDSDTSSECAYMANKILNLKAFEDSADQKKRISVTEMKGSILLVSNFTLYANCSKGLKPSFSQSANREHAVKLYSHVLDSLKKSGLNIQQGAFGEFMKIETESIGPFTLILEH